MSTASKRASSTRIQAAYYGSMEQFESEKRPNVVQGELFAQPEIIEKQPETETKKLFGLSEEEHAFLDEKTDEDHKRGQWK